MRVQDSNFTYNLYFILYFFFFLHGEERFFKKEVVDWMTRFGEDKLHKALLYSSLRKEGNLLLSLREEGYRQNSRCYSMLGY